MCRIAQRLFAKFARARAAAARTSALPAAAQLLPANGQRRLLGHLAVTNW
jgi:hypothetical protein